MKKREIRNAIKIVYQELWALLSLYEETDCFNLVPKGGRKIDNPDEEDAWNFVGRKIREIRKSVDTLLLGEQEVAKKLNQIIDETEYFTRQYEVPGVVTRWKRINPQLVYFDCAFDLMEKSPEAYMEMRRGLTDIHLSCYPDSELVKKRNAYFASIREKNERENLKYSEERIFQNELLNTLTLLFEDAFQKYL